MNGRRAKPRGTNKRRPEACEANDRRQPQKRSFRRIVAWTIGIGLFVAILFGSFAIRHKNFDAERLADVDVPKVVPISDADVPKIRAVCSRCHQFPAPEVLPRSAWKETIWQMFEVSGHGTTVKWPVDPEALVAWYEERSPQEFEFPTLPDESSGSHQLALLRQAVLPDQAKPAPVVSNILVEDVVGDDRPELIVCDMLNGQILMGGTEEPWSLSPIAEIASPAHVEVADLDADGRKDLIVANLGSFLALDHNLGSVEWLRQLDGNKFERITLADGFGRIADVDPVDMDGDGDLDVVVAEFGWRATGHLLLLENRTPKQGAPQFQVREIDGLHGASHVDVTDLNNDGFQDIIALYSQGHEMVRCYLQQEVSTFAIKDLYRAPSPAWGFSGSQLVDLDGDNDLDILLTNGDTFDNTILKPYHGVQWLENKGDLNFQPHQIGMLYGAYRAEAADMDGDGDRDVVACALITPNSRESLQLGENLDSIVWFEQVAPREFARHVLESGRCHHPNLTLSDFDRDGDVDLIVGNGQLTFTVETTAQGCVELWENRLNQPSD